MEIVPDMEYRLTTLEYELQQKSEAIEFALSRSDVESNPFQSLTYSVSIQKLSKTLMASPKKSDSQNQYCKNKSKPTEQDESPTFRIKLDKVPVKQIHRKLFKKKRPSTCQMIKHVVDRNKSKSTKQPSITTQNKQKIAETKLQPLNSCFRKISFKENNESSFSYKFSEINQNFDKQFSTAFTFNVSEHRMLYSKQQMKIINKEKSKSTRQNKLFPCLNGQSKKFKYSRYIEQAAKRFNQKLK